MKPKTVKEYLEQNPEAINGPFIDDSNDDFQYWRVRINGEVRKPKFIEYADAQRYFARNK